ncbi:MAG: membrane protein insertase YidC [Pyrinomonadaceae bacterium]
MQDENKQSNQTRFILAAALSMLVLLVWSYFFAPKPDNAANTNSNANITNVANANPQNSNGTQEAKNSETDKSSKEASEPAPADEVENRAIVIKSPLYEVTLDSKGAAATSWILLKNDSPYETERKDLYADGSDKTHKKPLQLVSPEGLKRNPSLAPLKLKVGDAGIEKIANERNYKISEEATELVLKPGETKELVFSMNGPGNVQAEKKFLFRGDSYVADVSVTVKKEGKVVPDTRLVIGPSISDQAIEVPSFYKPEPDAIYHTSTDESRQYAASAIPSGQKEGRMRINGDVQWAGVADTYFAMAAVPSKPMPGLEITSSVYEQTVTPYFDGIIANITRSETKQVNKHLVSIFVPIAADGSTNRIYTGTKDYFVLHKYNDSLSSLAGRSVDIGNLVNYGWLRFFTKPISVPILYALKFLYSIVSNYGIAIIIFTFFFYSLLFPLRWYSSKSFKKAQKNAPKMQELRDKMKKLQDKGVPVDDPRMRDLQMEQLRMTKDALPIGGCLPTLLQFPLIITLYYTVSISLGFRQEHFLWLKDLSTGDPYKILPIAFAASMILSMKFTPTTPAVTPEQQMQQKMMTYMMPAMMLFFMWSAPSGLLIYWFTGNVIMFGQQMLINWINREPETAEVAVAGGAK